MDLTGDIMKDSKHFNFHKLWLGQSISLLGTQFTIVALPLFALEVLQTSEANAAILLWGYIRPLSNFRVSSRCFNRHFP